MPNTETLTDSVSFPFSSHKAKEASKRIVEDLLLTAGMAGDDKDGEEEDLLTDDFAAGRGAGKRRMADETSPSVIRSMEDFEDESF